MEWTVVTVIIALVGLIAALWKPMSKLTVAITELREAARYMRDDFNDHKAVNAKEHQSMQSDIKEHGEKLTNHEQRITALEHDK